MTINTELVRKYHEEGNLTSLTTLFETMSEQKERSDLLARSYLHQITLLTKKFQQITEPASGRPVSESPRSAKREASGEGTGTGTARSVTSPKTSGVAPLKL